MARYSDITGRYLYLDVEGIEYRIYGYKGKQVRDNIHAEDVAAVAHAFARQPRVAEGYNIGGGKANSCSILEAFQIVESMTGRPMRSTYVDQARAGDHICYYSDLTKMRAHYPDWDVRISLTDTDAHSMFRFGTATLNAADWQFHPLKTALGVLAVVGLSRDDGREPVTADRAVLLSTLLGQAALAHERLKLESEVREVSVLKERDRLRAALLSSIGHDLRTPLTSVATAIEGLGVEQPGSPALPVARMEVARLRRFLDNLLDMVRIDSGALTLAPEPIDLTDAVASAVHDLKDLFRGRHIDLKVPANLPFVTADPTLLHHILINLLANAAQHGGEAGRITIEGSRTPDAVLLAIRDQGPGLEPGMEERIFETFAQGRGSDRQGGSGLGLAIVKGFADAMSIGVRAGNGPDGGAVFTIGFPNQLVHSGTHAGEV